MNAYPKLVRLAVLRESDAGKSTSLVAKEFKCSPGWVRRVKQERRELCKYGPYRYRRPNRHRGTLKRRIKEVLIEDPSMSVSELEQGLGCDLTIQTLINIRDELVDDHDIYWYGAEGCLPPTELSRLVTRIDPCSSPNAFQFVLKQRVSELFHWRPQLSRAELENILNVSLSAELIAEAKEDTELARARGVRAGKHASPWPYMILTNGGASSREH